MSPAGVRRVGGGRAGRPRGFVLIELALAGLILALLSVWAAHAWAQRVRDLQAQSLAVWMTVAHDAAHAYLRRHGAALALADGPGALVHEGFDDWSAPGWDELRAAGLAPPGWLETGPLGQSAGLRILRSGSCPGPACRLTALVHTRGPLLARNGQSVDEGLVAQWLMAVRGQGLVVWPHAPGVLSGAARRFPAPEGWRPGTVALAAADADVATSVDGAPDLSPYLKVGDDRDPDFQGDATVGGSIRSGASLRARDYLVLERTGVEYEGCGEEGALTIERDHNGILLCRQGRWHSAGRADGGGFLSNSHRGCHDGTGAYRGNPITGYCSCPFGYAPVMVSDVGTLASAEGRTSGFICMAAQ